MHGGVDGNERLTASTAVVLLVLLALEGATLVSVTQLLVPHVFLGFLLIPPVALKLGSTGWRLLRYYRRSEPYVRRGPPHPFLRLRRRAARRVSTVAPLRLRRRCGRDREPRCAARPAQGELHRLGRRDGVHVLWHVWKLPQLVLDRLPGRGLRLAAVGAALGAGLVLAVATVPLADHWQDRTTRVFGIDSA